MTAPYQTVALDRRMLAVHAKPSAHRPWSRQGVLSTPLTQKEFSAFLERLRFAKDKAEFDQFMDERRTRPPAPSEPPSGQPQG